MPKKSKIAHGAKASFVRANPTATAQELVKLGKKQGILLTAGHVYNIRANDKARRSSLDRPLPSSALNSGSSAPESGRLDAQLRSLVLRIGLDRAEQVFSELKSTISKIA